MAIRKKSEREMKAIIKPIALIINVAVLIGLGMLIFNSDPDHGPKGAWFGLLILIGIEIGLVYNLKQIWKE